MTVDLDQKHLQGIVAEIGYRLCQQLGRDTYVAPQHLLDLVRALDDQRDRRRSLRLGSTISTRRRR